MQALEIHLRFSLVSYMQNYKDLCEETILHQRRHSDWSIVTDDAKNVVEAVKTCLESCSSNDTVRTAIMLAALNKVETALMWSAQAARTEDSVENKVYLAAAKMVRESEKCLMYALCAHCDGDFELKHLWITAAESVRETANRKVYIMDEALGAAIIRPNATLEMMVNVADAKANATADAAGKPALAARWLHLARLRSAATSLQYTVPFARSSKYAAASKKAEMYHTCLAASISLDSTIVRLSHKQQQQWQYGVDALVSCSHKLDLVLDTDAEFRVHEQISTTTASYLAAVSALLAEVSAAQYNYRTVEAEDEQLRTRLLDCTEKLMHASTASNGAPTTATVTASSFQHNQRNRQDCPDNQGIVAAWTAAAHCTERDIAAWDAIIQNAESASWTVPNFAANLPKSASAQWVAMASWMQELLDAALSAERSANAVTSDDYLYPSTENERYCYTMCASVLRLQLQSCATLLVDPESSLEVLAQTRSNGQKVKEIAITHTKRINVLYETAQHMRMSAAATAVYAVANNQEPAAELVSEQLAEVAVWYEQQGDQAVQYMQDWLVDQQHQSMCGSFEEFRLQRDWEQANLSCPLLLLQNPQIALRVTNAQLQVLLGTYRALFCNTADGSAVQFPTAAVRINWELESSAQPNSSNSEDKTKEFRHAVMTFKAAARHFKQMKYSVPSSFNSWSSQYRANLSKAESVCALMADCLQCAINAGHTKLIETSDCVLAQFYSMQLLENASEEHHFTSIVDRELYECFNELPLSLPMSLLWYETKLHLLRARLLKCAGEQDGEKVAIVTAARYKQEAKLMMLSQELHAGGYSGAAELCDRTLQRLYSGDTIPAAFILDLKHIALLLPQVTALHQQCLEKVFTCTELQLKSVWTHLADMVAAAVTRVDSKLGLGETAIAEQELSRCVQHTIHCIQAAEQLGENVALLHACSAQLGAAKRLPTSAVGTAGIQRCWQEAVQLLEELAGRTIKALLDVDLSTARTMGTYSDMQYYDLVRAKVHSYTVIAHTYFTAASWAQQQQALCRIDATPADCVVGVAGVPDCSVRDHLANAAGSLELAGRNRMRTVAAATISWECDPNHSRPTTLAGAKQHLLLAEYLAAALRATDIKVRTAYFAAYEHKNATRSAAAVLFAELAYTMEKGTSPDSLQALQAACTYAAQNGVPNSPLSDATHIALCAHRLESAEVQDVPRLLCAAQLFAESGSPSRTLLDATILSKVASLLLPNKVPFCYVAALDMLRLSGIEHSAVEFAVNSAELSPVVLPYVEQYATVVLDKCGAKLKLAEQAWCDVYYSYSDCARKISTLVSALPSATPSVTTLAALQNQQLVAERLKKAALAKDVGKEKISECWRLAASVGGKSDQPAEMFAIAQRFADAAEALENGHLVLSEALMRAAKLNYSLRGVTQREPDRSQKMERKAAEVAVEAARADCANKLAAAALFGKAARKFTLAAQKLALAKGTTKVIATRAVAAAKALVSEGKALEEQAVQALAD